MSRTSRVRMRVAMAGAALLALAACSHSSSAPTQQRSGVLQVQVASPAGVTPAIAVTGPGGYSTTLAGSRTLSGLAPGPYVVVAEQVYASGAIYGAPSSIDSVAVDADGIPTTVSFQYALLRGSLQLTVSGLPAATPADIEVTGPVGIDLRFHAHDGDTTLVGLPAGNYVVFAYDVLSGATTFGVVNGTSDVPVDTSYALAFQYAAVPTAHLAGFNVATPGGTYPGDTFVVGIAAIDSSGNIATSYAGTVQLASSDPLASSMSSHKLVNGVGSFKVTMGTLGNQTITASDSAAASLSGTSPYVTVAAPGTLIIVGYDPPDGRAQTQYGGFRLVCPSLGIGVSGFQLLERPASNTVSWSGDSLPPGLRIDHVALSFPPPCGIVDEWVLDGVPQTAGTYTFTLSASINHAAGMQSRARTYTITIH